MSQVALSLSGVTKIVKTPFSRRPGFKVGPLDLSIGEGEIVGLIGANGAGKTTTLKLLLGLLVPDAGRIELVGTPSGRGEWRASVGYLPEQPAFYEYLSGREFLMFVGDLFGLAPKLLSERVASLLERVGIAESANRPIRTYSKGMQQRLGIAQALLNDPKLLLLDEPMSGLDPIGRRFVRDLLLELRAQGRSILFSTHIIPDAEFVCDRIALMRVGQLTAVGTVDDLLGLPTGFEIAAVKSMAGSTAAEPGAGKVDERFTVRVPPAELTRAIEDILGRGAHLVSVSPIRASVEDLLAPKAKEA
jgi:ABC-2 type transport system ATP-binding protein